MAIMEFDTCAIRADKIVYAFKNDVGRFTVTVAVEGYETPLNLNFPNKDAMEEAYQNVRKAMLLSGK